MKEMLSLKTAERRVFQATLADGLWDVFLGSFVLIFAIAPLLSRSLGDFWSSIIFLPFWGLVYLLIRLAREKVVAPRLGTVHFGEHRRRRLQRFTIVMVIVNLVALVAGIVAFARFNRITESGTAPMPGGLSSLLGLFMLMGFSLAAYLLDFPRLYLYGMLLGAASVVGEWLYQNHGAAHHGYPVAFGAAAGLMILAGLVMFARFVMVHPAEEKGNLDG